MKTQNTTTITNTLTSLQEQHSGEIISIVVSDALDSELPLSYLKDVTHHGCISGMVSGLTYYSNTHAFFDKHYDEIHDLISDYKDNTGVDLVHTDDLKNFYAWFAYEHTAYEILNKLTDGA